MEAADGGGAGTPSRSRELRRLPASLRRPTLLLAVPGGSGGGGQHRPQRSGPLLPPGRGGSRRSNHPPEASGVPPLPRRGGTVPPSTSGHTHHGHVPVLPPPATAFTFAVSGPTQSPVRRRRGRLA